MARLAHLLGLVLIVAVLAGGAPATAGRTVIGDRPSSTDLQSQDQADQRLLLASYESGKTPETAEVASAVWQASQATGVDYEYLMAKARLESGLDPDARARTSSAVGLFQFIESTWLSSLERYSPVSGELFAMAGEAETVHSRQERLELRKDPFVAAMIAAAYARENGDALGSVLGRPASHSELYLAHFLGTGGAVRFVRELQHRPQASAARSFPQAARANRLIFYTRSGRARTFAEVLAHFDAKLDSAMAQNGQVYSTVAAQTDLDTFSSKYRQVTRDSKYSFERQMGRSVHQHFQDTSASTALPHDPTQFGNEVPASAIAEAHFSTEIDSVTSLYGEGTGSPTDEARSLGPIPAWQASSAGLKGSPSPPIPPPALFLQSHPNVLSDGHEHINNHTSSRARRFG